MTKLTTIMFLIFLFGCSRDGRPVQTTDNASGNGVEYLFTVDGCKMYKFYDFNRVYFMTCPNSSTQYEVNCGKSCTKKVQQVTK